MKPLGMVHIGFSDADLERAFDSARPYILHDQEKPGEFMRRRARLGRSPIRRRAASTSRRPTWRDTSDVPRRRQNRRRGARFVGAAEGAL